MTNPAEKRDVRGNTIKPHSVEAESVNTKEARLTDTETLYAYVPSDYATLKEAIDELAKIQRPENTTFRIQLEDGYAIEEQVELIGGDYSHIEIGPQHHVLPVSDNFPDDTDVFRLNRGCTGPRLVIDLDGEGKAKDGFVANQGSRFLTVGGGASNMGRFGLHVKRAYAHVANGVFSGNGDNGINVEGGSTAILRGGQTIEDNGTHGISAVRASQVHLSRDQSGRRMTIQNNTSRGIRATDAATVNAVGATVNDNGVFGVEAVSGGILSSRSGDVSGNDASNDVSVDEGGIVSVYDTSTTQSTGDQPHEDDVRHRGFDETDGIIFGNFETA